MSFEEREPIISETQLYDDLSVALVHFREILRYFLSKASPKNYLEDTIQSRNQQTSQSTFTELIMKYNRNLVINHQFDSIMQRFMGRIKEILRHFINNAPRYRTATTLILKNLESTTLQATQNSQYRLVILTVLEFIDSFTSKVTNHLPTNRPKTIRQDFHSSLERRKTPDTTIHKQYLEFKTARKQSEAQEFVKNVRRYDCMGLDVQYLRGKYFNMKKNEKQQISSSLNRNQYIRTIISSFERYYENNKNKLTPIKTMRRNQGKSNNKLSSAPHLGEQDQKIDNFLEPVKEDNFLTISNNSLSGESDRKFKTLEPNKLKSNSIRNVYQEKLKECKNVRMKNVVICDQETPVSIHAFNPKKADFFKKSKDQTKFRYKYYTYIRREANQSHHPLKSKNINPELMFTTLTYK